MAEERCTQVKNDGGEAGQADIKIRPACSQTCDRGLGKEMSWGGEFSKDRLLQRNGRGACTDKLGAY